MSTRPSRAPTLALAPTQALAPTLAAVGLGWAWLVWRAEAFQVRTWPDGFDWFESARLAWLVVHMPDVATHDFRMPTWPWLLGHVGEVLGYAQAATVLSSLATMGTVLAAGIGARALGGPWAGAAAAVLTAASYTVGASVHWMNVYPLLTCLMALAVALALEAWRCERWWTAVGAGLACAAAMAVDWRGVVVLVICVALGLWRWWGTGRSKAAVCLVLIPWLGVGVQAANPWASAKSPAAQVAFQREQARNELLYQGYDKLWAVCDELDNADLDVVSAINHRCRRALVQLNLRQLGPVTPVAPLVVLFGLLGWAAPGRLAGARVAALVVAAPTLGALLVLFQGAIVPTRYRLFLLVPLLIVACAGAIRALRAIRRLPNGTGGPLGLGVLVLLAVVHDPKPLKVDIFERSATYRAMGEITDTLAAQVALGEVVMDCARTFQEIARLPVILGRPGGERDLMERHPHRDACLEVVQHRASFDVRWLITGGSGPITASETLPGWVEVHRTQIPTLEMSNFTYQAWKRDTMAGVR